MIPYLEIGKLGQGEMPTSETGISFNSSSHLEGETTILTPPSLYLDFSAGEKNIDGQL